MSRYHRLAAEEQASVRARFFKYASPVDPSTCWQWRGSTKGPGAYGQIRVGQTVVGAHRLSYEIHFGPIPRGSLVCHHCDNPPCVNPAHLFLGTNADNTRDKVLKGRAAAKLATAQAREIRARYRNGETARALAREFGVHRSSIFRLINCETWAHLD